MKKIYLLIVLLCIPLVYSLPIDIDDYSVEDWGIYPNVSDWTPEPGIYCNNFSVGSEGGPNFDEFMMCFYDTGGELMYYLKLVGASPNGTHYFDPWERGPVEAENPGEAVVIAGDLYVDFCMDETVDCAISIFDRSMNHSVFPWGSFADNDFSELGGVYCNHDGNYLEFYCPGFVAYTGAPENCPVLSVGNSSLKIGEVDVSYFDAGEIPWDVIFFTLWGPGYPHFNWVYPLPYKYPTSNMTIQNLTDNFQLYAVEIEINKSIFGFGTELYDFSHCTTANISEEMSCGNDITIGEVEIKTGGPGEVPEFNAITIIIGFLMIVIVLGIISYRRGTLFRHHKNIKEMFNLMRGKRK